jgi:hypothetical protein
MQDDSQRDGLVTGNLPVTCCHKGYEDMTKDLAVV